MPIHDMIIDNAVGATVRADINSALAALVANSSNATEPTTMYAYQWWADTTTGLLKQRNAANTAWLTKLVLSEGQLALLAGSATQTFSVAAPSNANHAVNSGFFAPISAELGADVALNNTANYFTGPSIAQGSTGTWFVSGTVTVRDTAGSAGFHARLTDGTSVIASTQADSAASNATESITLSGYIASPAGNLRIEVKDVTSTSGAILFNATGNSLDSRITAIKIGV